MLPSLDIQNLIYTVRGQSVMLDRDLAMLYQVSTGRLNEAVKRNRERFPEDFMFQLTKEEAEQSRSQFVIFNTDSKSNTCDNLGPSKSQNAILNKGRGSNIKYLPFTSSFYFTNMRVKNAINNINEH